MQVSAAESTASDCAGSGRRSRLNRPTSSSAKCCASTELPPFPKVYARPPPSRAPISRRPTSSTRGSSSSVRAERARWSARASALDSGMREGVAGGGPLEGDRRGADDADVLPERRLNDLRGSARRRHRVGAHAVPHGAEQLLAGTADDAAPEHDELGLEEVHD